MPISITSLTFFLSIIMFRNDAWCSFMGNNGRQIWPASNSNMGNVFPVLVRNTDISIAILRLGSFIEVFRRGFYRRCSSGKRVYFGQTSSEKFNF